MLPGGRPWLLNATLCSEYHVMIEGQAIISWHWPQLFVAIDSKIPADFGGSSPNASQLMAERLNDVHQVSVGRSQKLTSEEAPWTRQEESNGYNGLWASSIESVVFL